MSPARFAKTLAQESVARKVLYRNSFRFAINTRPVLRCYRYNRLSPYRIEASIVQLTRLFSGTSRGQPVANPAQSCDEQQGRESRGHNYEAQHSEASQNYRSEGCNHDLGLFSWVSDVFCRARICFGLPSAVRNNTVPFIREPDRYSRSL